MCSFSTNPGDKVKITAEISWSQDLRVSLIDNYMQEGIKIITAMLLGRTRVIWSISPQTD